MAGKPWIADFDAGGALMAAHVDLEPLGMVIGNGVFVPIITGVPANSAEVSDASKLATKGWDTVLTRMREQAAKLGADGIVSIQCWRSVLDHDQRVTEFCGIGTAVKGLPRPGGVWTAEIGPTEIALLVGQGYSPVALAIGCCTWHQSSYGWNPARGKGLNTYVSQEVTPATKALYIARATAMGRMQDEARKYGASGVLGSRIEFTSVHSEGMLTGFVAGCEAYGTAVAPRFDRFRNPDTTCVVPLNG